MIKKILVSVLIVVLVCVHCAYASAPIVTDTRAATIDQYFKLHNMPLQGYGSIMVATADKYDIDWRLLPALSVQESTGGKHMCKNNPYGYGSCRITFSTITEATDTVGKALGGFNQHLTMYKNSDTQKKLYYYNGTVQKSYPKEVMSIMASIK